jgi:Ca2+-binding RTX toxin-like protein
VSFTLGDFIENLTLTGAGAVDGIGNGLGNKITGNNSVNSLRGGEGNDNMLGNGGNDFLYGEGGNDTLSGGIGDDWLEGGAGFDQLSGGTGADKFILSGPLGGSADKIMDFVRLDGDKLVIKGLEYGLGAGSLSGALLSSTGVATSAVGTGQFVYNAVSKSLFWDANGSGSGEGVLIASFATNVGLSSSDFLII